GKQSIVGKNVAYSGSGVRFYFPGGQYSLIVEGTGIDISAVGKGTISALGAGLPDDGSFTIVGGKPRSIDNSQGSYAFGKNGGVTASVSTVTGVSTSAKGH
ncbi:MAG TPA: hypothetical protein VLV46_00005, partial [Gaiellaceae bacterium]|nr:hypothetical protein [Gaiellaceae bacterium]